MTHGGTGDLVRQLGMLADLHAAGALDGDEFALAKQRLLSAGGVGRTPGLPAAGQAIPSQATPVQVTPMQAAPGQADPAQAFPTQAIPTQAAPARADAAPPAAPAPRPFDPDAPLTEAERSAAAAADAVARQRRGRVGAAVAGGGGLVTLLAFLAMPIATVPFLGSVSGSALAGYSSELGSLGLLWLIPLSAATVAGLSAWQLFGADPGSGRAAAVVSTVAAILACVVYLVGFGQLQSAIGDSGGSAFGIDASDFIGSGFWIGLLASAVSLLASAVAAVPATPPAGGR